MAKARASKGNLSEVMVWTVTIFALALTCAALAMLIQENQELQEQNEALMAVVDA